MPKVLKKLFTIVLILLVLSLILYFTVFNPPKQISDPVLTNINTDSIEIADSVELVNLFNPDIIGKENIGYSIAYLTLKPGAVIPLRSLENNEIEYFIKGKGTIIINNKIYNIKAGDAL